MPTMPIFVMLFLQVVQVTGPVPSHALFPHPPAQM
jgi:hypothetical protein